VIVCLDSNVLASGVLGLENPLSTPGEVLRAWEARAFTLVISQHMLDEVERTLTDPYFQRRLTPEEINRGNLALRQRGRLIPITVTVSGVATHPEDDLVIATALSAKAQYLVTGDAQLQKLAAYQGLTLLSPRAFLGLLTARP
jgi:putative PIN family toxin of toxin-antitoxin system